MTATLKTHSESGLVDPVYWPDGSAVSARIEFLTKYPNPSGIRPTEFKVVVLPKDVEEVTKGGIFIPPSKVDAEKYATQEATIVAIAEKAFSEADIWGSNPPKVGDVVLFAKYAGLLRKGKDGKDYRVLNDKDVCAVLE